MTVREKLRCNPCGCCGYIPIPAHGLVGCDNCKLGHVGGDYSSKDLIEFWNEANPLDAGVKSNDC